MPTLNSGAGKQQVPPIGLMGFVPTGKPAGFITSSGWLVRKNARPVLLVVLSKLFNSLSLQGQAVLNSLQ